MRKHIPQTFNKLEMMMLPISEQTLTFEDELMLTDNFNSPPIEEKEITRFIHNAYPFKVMFNMIQICKKGYMRIRYNLQEYVIRENTVAIILPNSIGECVEISKDFQMAFITYKEDNYLNGHDSAYPAEFRNRLTSQAVACLPDGKMEELLTLYRMMRKRVREPHTEFTREALKGFMQVMLAECYQELSDTLEIKESNYRKNRQKYLFDKFLTLVQKNYTRERSVTFYADLMCLTPKYLSQAIFQASGRHAGEWIKEYVILDAKTLLKNGRYTVQQVSDLLNFANASFFGKYFKAATGYSPKKYQLSV